MIERLIKRSHKTSTNKLQKITDYDGNTSGKDSKVGDKSLDDKEETLSNKRCKPLKYYYTGSSLVKEKEVDNKYLTKKG